ncbi:hypothetical protein IWX48DRAFT_594379 [Phyllosticta citricarpa]
MVTYALPRRQRKQYPTHCKEHDIPSLSQRFHNGGTSTCCAAKDEGALAIEPRRGGGLAGVDADVGVGTLHRAVSPVSKRLKVIGTGDRSGRRLRPNQTLDGLGAGKPKKHWRCTLTHIASQRRDPTQCGKGRRKRGRESSRVRRRLPSRRRMAHGDCVAGVPEVGGVGWLTGGVESRLVGVGTGELRCLPEVEQNAVKRCEG